MPAKAVSEKEVNALKVTELKELLDKNGVKTPAKAKKADLQELAIKNIVGGRESDAVASPKRGRPRKSTGAAAASPSPPPRATPSRRKSKAEVAEVAKTPSPVKPTTPAPAKPSFVLEEEPSTFEQFRWTILTACIAVAIAVASQAFGTFSLPLRH